MPASCGSALFPTIPHGPPTQLCFAAASAGAVGTSRHVLSSSLSWLIVRKGPGSAVEGDRRGGQTGGAVDCAPWSPAKAFDKPSGAAPEARLAPGGRPPPRPRAALSCPPRNASTVLPNDRAWPTYRKLVALGGSVSTTRFSRANWTRLGGTRVFSWSTEHRCMRIRFSVSESS